MMIKKDLKQNSRRKGCLRGKRKRKAREKSEKKEKRNDWWKKRKTDNKKEEQQKKEKGRKVTWRSKKGNKGRDEPRCARKEG
jgi:hypothetical protein